MSRFGAGTGLPPFITVGGRISSVTCAHFGVGWNPGAPLGLVYSSDESICAALRCGRGVYWSRSRQSLWRKGDTSGAWQTLRRIRLDSDADTLCFIVTQHGEPPAFCHKGTLSCWGPPSGLQALQLTLRQRKANAPPGSYTKRLFDDPGLLRNKLVEEAQELAECANPTVQFHAGWRGARAHG